MSAVQAYHAAGSIWRHSLSVSVPLVFCTCPLCRRITRQVAYGSIWRHSLSVSVPLVLCTCPLCRRITRQLEFGATAFQCLCLWYSARVRCAGVSRGRWYMAPQPFSVCALGALHVSVVQAHHAAGSLRRHILSLFAPLKYSARVRCAGVSRGR